MEVSASKSIAITAAPDRLLRSARGLALAGILAVLSLTAGFSQAFGQAKGSGVDLLSAELSSTPLPARSGAPITVVWRLKSQSVNVQEGRLELVVHDGDEVLARVTSDEMAIGNGEQQYRMVLPTLTTHNPYGAVDMRLRFVGPKQAVDFGVYPLLLPSPWERKFVVAVCDAWEAAPSHEKQQFLQRFHFESYGPDADDRTITTHVTDIQPENLPADALGLCSFDLVVVLGRGLTELKAPQLDALTSWVDAGGSVCLLPDRSVLKTQHLEFLNRLCRKSADEPFTLDMENRLVIPDGDFVSTEIDTEQIPSNDPRANAIAAETGRVRRRRYGLGRSALLPGKIEAIAELDQVFFRSVLAFLWKMRADQAPLFIATGKWRPDAVVPPTPTEGPPATAFTPQVVMDASGQPIVVTNPYAVIRPRDKSLASVSLQTGDQLLARLMPRDLKIVPLKLIGFVLFLYILVIGPLDYFLLGAIRRRRWTWIVFPAVSVGFAWATISVSNWYMRFDDDRRAVTIADVGEEGRIVRSNRFETLFRAVPDDVPTDVTRGILTAMNLQKFSRGTWYAFQQATTRGTEDQLDLVAVPQYTGRVPTRYRVDQSLPQWTPQLNRLLQAPASLTAPAFDWNVAAGLSVHDPNGQIRPDISREIQAAFGPQASAFAVTANRLHRIAGPAHVLHPLDPQAKATAAYTPYQNIYYNSPPETTSFLQDLCSAAATGGLFGVVSQLSPNGGADFEDLALLDPSTPGQWVLVVAVENGDDLVVYRKLYSGEAE